MKKFLPLVLVTLCCNSAFAIFANEHGGFDSNLLKPPQTLNENLNKTVNFSFAQTPLSNILILLSKVGNFNVVLPEDLDKDLTVTLANEKVIDAIDDVCEIANLEYEFKTNSLIISSPDIQGTQFVSIPILYRNASDIVRSLNKVLYSQLAISQSPESRKAFAAVEPGTNNIIASGNKEQVEATQKFISRLDQVPKVKIYSPSYLKLADARDLARVYFHRDEALKIQRHNKKSFLIKGPAYQVEEFYKLLKKHDQIPKDIELIAELHVISNEKSELFQEINNSIRANEFMRIDRAQESMNNLLRFFRRLSHQKLSFKYPKKNSLWGLNFTAYENLIDPETYCIEGFNKKLSGLSKNDLATILLSSQDPKLSKEVRNLVGKDNALVMLSFRSAD